MPANTKIIDAQACTQSNGELNRQIKDFRKEIQTEILGWKISDCCMSKSLF